MVIDRPHGAALLAVLLVDGQVTLLHGWYLVAVRALYGNGSGEVTAN